MRRFLSFWWLCVRTAAGGNSTFANDWQWVFGNPAVSAFGTLAIVALGGIAPSVFARFGVTEMTTGMPALDSFLGAFAAFLITWLIAFVFRLFYAPVTLFHQQKDRADALDGTPIARPQSSDKNLAILQERYLSDRPTIERELLDYEVDGLRATNDVTLIFDGLTSLANKLTKIMARHATKIRRIQDSEKKRLAVSRLAVDINSYSTEVENYTAVFRVITPALLEYAGQFIERSPQVPDETYIGLGEVLGANVQSSVGVSQAISDTQRIAVSSLRGVSADLNSAATRLESVNALLLIEANNYKIVCEELQSLVTGRMTQRGELQNNQPAV